MLDGKKNFVSRVFVFFIRLYVLRLVFCLKNVSRGCIICFQEAVKLQPLLSIVIANYNYGRFLEEAIQSVLMQDAGDLAELIICDAESTDNSVEVIKKYEKHITWWCSEKDGGQSAAFNKGFSHARGKFLTWLNLHINMNLQL